MAAENKRPVRKSADTTAADRLERLAGMPPSAKLVYYVLDRVDEPLSSSDVADRALLSDRTARYALNELLDVGIVLKRPETMDARKRRYELVETDDW